MDQIENKPVEAQESVQVQDTPVVENQQVENPQERNWRLFREQREQERKQKEAAEKLAAQKAQEAEALKAAMDALLNKPSSSSHVQAYEEDISEDEKIQKKVEAALLARERQLEEQRRIREQQEFPQRLAQTFSDFEKVCTIENLDYLEYHYPEVAAPFKHLPDGYDKWAAVYKAVKRFVPNTESRKEQAKADKNFNKPQSASVPGVTRTGDTAPQFLDEKRKMDNWTRMQKVMKGIS